MHFDGKHSEMLALNARSSQPFKNPVQENSFAWSLARARDSGTGQGLGLEVPVNLDLCANGFMGQQETSIPGGRTRKLAEHPGDRH